MDKPYLTLVDPQRDQSHDQEFIPLPHYPWKERPPSVPLEVEECETAIHLAQGDLPKASSLLKTPLYKLNRMITRSPRLQHVWQEAHMLLAHKAAAEVIAALHSDNDRRREWAATKILSSRSTQSHPLAPAPPQPNSQSIAISTPSRTITFRFRTDDDPDPDVPA